MPPQLMPPLFLKDMGFAGRRKVGMRGARRVQRLACGRRDLARLSLV